MIIDFTDYKWQAFFEPSPEKKKNHSLLSPYKMKRPRVETGAYHSVVCLEIPKIIDCDKIFQNVETLQPKE